jgi:hypothetical protein
VPKESRGICGGRLETMNGELCASGKPSFTKRYSRKRSSAAAGHNILSYSWDSDEETEQLPKTKNHKTTAAILEDQEWKHQEYRTTVYS